MRKPYKTDLTDFQWTAVAPLLPPAKHGGAPRKVNLREVVNTILYQAKAGCPWDMLPHDLQARSTSHGYLLAWEADGTWQRILDVLRARIRREAGREETRRGRSGCWGSWTVPTTPGCARCGRTASITTT